MSLIVYSPKGFRSWIRGKKNLTLALVGMYLVMVFFLNLFGTLRGNLSAFWRTGFVGGDVAHEAGALDIDLTRLVPYGEYVDVADFARENPGLDASPRIRIGTLLEGADSKPVILIGVDWAREAAMGSHLGLLSGRGPLPDEKSIVIPEGMVYELGAQGAEDITVSAQTVDGYPNYDRLRVVGLLETNVAVAWLSGGSFIAYADRGTVADLIMADRAKASEILVEPDRTVRGHYGLTEGERAFPVSRVLSTAYRFLEASLIAFILSFSLVLSYYNVGLAVVQRKKEMGTYMAFGASPAHVCGLLFAELGLYSAFCWMAGVALAALLASAVNALSIDAITPAVHIILAAPSLRIAFDWGNAAIALALLSGAILLSALWPILRTVLSRDIVSSLYRAR